MNFAHATCTVVQLIWSENMLCPFCPQVTTLTTHPRSNGKTSSPQTTAVITASVSKSMKKGYNLNTTTNVLHSRGGFFFFHFLANCVASTLLSFSRQRSKTCNFSFGDFLCLFPPLHPSQIPKILEIYEDSTTIKSIHPL